ncbi:hypothetical protein C7293_29490, partial [filamentous cyanobacterium CCT1]
MSDRGQVAGVPAARQDPVLRRYPLRRLRLPVGAAQLSLVVPDERAWRREGSWTANVLRGGEPPYWLRVWPAAVAIARQLDRAAALMGVRVLDLGCGLGVPGVAAARAGAEVFFVDREADAVAFATWNAEANRAPAAPRATGRALDWSRDAVPGPFDLVLLSDVSYHPAHHAPLQRQLARALAPTGCVVHADPGRELSSRFVDRLVAAGARTAQWRR